jgi:DNA (cytosine-5)-methyltransferase 1
MPLNAIDLFSGYGGISLALDKYTTPLLYCEKEPYAQAILLSRMDDGTLPFAPIWNDVTTLDGTKFRGLVDLIYGGFPCQDISVAGKGAGLEGKRSGLFYEVARLIKEIKPSWVFLENVPAIRSRGSIEVQETLASLGYGSRWLTLSAAEVGANHRRERWFCLAHAYGAGHSRLPSREETQVSVFGGNGKYTERDLPNTNCPGLQEEGSELLPTRTFKHGAFHPQWWKAEPNVGRVADGVAFRPHRIKALGNGVVPLQVRTAFETLMGITGGELL